MTFGLFLSDTVKSVVLEVIIQNLFMVVIEGVIRFFGDNFFFFLWTAFLVIMFVLLTIHPIFIAPLFNKFEPLDINDPKEKEL